VNPVSPFEIAGLVALGLAGAGALYALIATVALWRFSRRSVVAPEATPSVTVLRPLFGDEPELQENLASGCRQTYAGPVQTILGAQDPSDAALTVARGVQSDCPGQDISVSSHPLLHGTNRKISNLINLSAQARGDVVIIADSDVRFPPDAFNAIIAELDQPGVGLVYCLYRGRPTESGWSALAALDINTRFAPSVVIGQALGFNPCLGPAMALRADVLDQIGGLERLADVLADDYELGRAVRQAGYRVSYPPLVIDHVFPETSFTDLFTHELRWARTVRLVEPGGYFGSVIVHFLPLALIGSALTGFSPPTLAVLAGLTLFRLIHAGCLCRLLGAERRGLWLTPVLDLLSFGVFLVGAVGARVEWRGVRSSVLRDGTMSTT
jgi:ceramide glucosyltransferase